MKKRFAFLFFYLYYNYSVVYSYSGSAMRIFTGLIIIKILTFLTELFEMNHRKVGFMVKLLLLVTSIVGETALVG